MPAENSRFVAAVVQLTSVQDPERNLRNAESWVERAAAVGAKLVVLPENVVYIADDDRDEAKRQIADAWFDVARDRMAALARSLCVTLIAGTYPEPDPVSRCVFNTLLVFGPDGALLARYRKIHLFDIALSHGPTHRESDTVSPGAEVVVAPTVFGGIGLSVCYDVRFPELFRHLVSKGAEMLAVPAAFTVPTGHDHWEVLLRARAIENLSYVFAAAQVGRHTAKRATFGRSVIVDPWGIVLANAGTDEGFVTAAIDLERVRRLRRELPCLSHRRIG
ncbi:MAG: carbon-nitrogen hydrolase family protein [Deltaproteobacteria bacterium]|nr:carbon-nitrogen hydrolase family protein [Deltaproteobacteria bacterium]